MSPVVYYDDFLGVSIGWDIWTMGPWCLPCKGEVYHTRCIQNSLSYWFWGGLLAYVPHKPHV